MFTPQPQAKPKADVALPLSVRRLPETASRVVIGITGIVLAGWILDLPVLTSILPGLPPMQPVTALTFLLAGGSLYGRHRVANGWISRLSVAGAVAVILIALLVLLEYLLGLDFGMALWPDSESGAEAIRSHRMSPHSAVAFLLAGSALMLRRVETRGGLRPAQYLAAAAGFVALLAVIGYLYRFTLFYGIDTYTGMSLPTILGFTALSLGLLATDAERGFVALVLSPGMRGVMLRQLLPAAVGLPVVLGWIRFLGERTGFYDAAFGTALMAVLMILALVWLVWHHAARLDHLDRERQSQLEWLRGTLASISDAVIATDTQARIAFMNPVAEKLTGWIQTEARGRDVQNIFNVVHEETRGVVENPVTKVLRSGAVQGLANHTCLVARDGTEWPIDDSGAPIRDEAGNLLGVVLVFREISERRRAELALREAHAALERQVEERTAELRESEERLQLFIEHAPVSLAMFDQQMRYLAASRRWITEYLSGRRDFVGHSHYEVFPACPERWRAAHRRGLAGETVRLDEDTWTMADGQTQWARYEVRPWCTTDGTVGGIVIFTEDITERKRAEAALRESEERLRLAQSAAQLGIWDWQLQSGVLSWTPELERLYGYAEGTFPGTYAAFAETVHPDDLPKAERWRDEAVTAHQPFDFDFRVRTVSGETRWLNCKGSAVYDEAGSPQRILGVNIDITGRKETEESLFTSNQRLMALMNALPVGVSFTDDAACRHVTGNPALLAQFEVAPTDNVSASAPDLSAPGRRVRYFRDGRPITDRELPLQRAVTENRQIPPLELEVWLPSGRRWLMEASGDPIRDQTGNAIGGVAVTVDITERKHSENALLQSRRDLDHAQEVVQVGSWRLDVRQNVLTWSDENHRIFGVPKGTPLTYESFLGIVHPDDRPCVDAQWKAALRGAPYDIEHRIVLDGHVKWVREKAYLEFDEGGKLLGGFGITQDISERKRAEEALRDADRRKDEFLAMLAHELRNPLAPIRTGLYVLRKVGDQNPATERVHAMMERQVNQLIRLVDDLLELSRINRGKIELRKVRVELAAIVGHAVETSQSLIEAAGHELTVSLPPEPLFLDADPVRLAQVFSNLLNNAAKYMERGGKIWLGAERQRQQLVVTVRDEGEGISAGMLPRVFDLFTQVDRSRGRSQGGLGIGLTLVRYLVEMHGGRVEVRSEGIGRGSEFLVYLPLAACGQADTAEPKTPPPALTSRVLVVDDNPDIADSIGLALECAGAEVRVVYDGPSALEVLPVFRPASVLLDLGMPGMDGYETARRIREDPAGQAVTLIALTGWGQDEERDRTRQAGFDDHLVKPVDLDVLQTRLAGLASEPPGNEGKNVRNPLPCHGCEPQSSDRP